MFTVANALKQDVSKQRPHVQIDVQRRANVSQRINKVNALQLDTPCIWNCGTIIKQCYHIKTILAT